MEMEIGVSLAQGLDVSNFFKNVPNFMKDVPNFIKDVPRVPKSIPREGITSNHFPRVFKERNEPWEGT